MQEPTVYTLAARIAAPDLVRITGNHRRWPNVIDVEQYRAACDAALDEALDVAVFAVWEHTTGEQAAEELARVAA